jgi:heme-degrading monooxygenase HmoA
MSNIRVIIDNFYHAWNVHAAAKVAELFGARGVYIDPVARFELRGDALGDYVQSVINVIGNLRISVSRTLFDSNAAVVVWIIEGKWDGKLGPMTASGIDVRVEGIDLFEFEEDALVRVRRSFDERALADALGLQTIVEPCSVGTTTFGYSLRNWVSKEKPGVLGMTWIVARDETEKLAIRARAREIMHHFEEIPGFIGIVTGFAGLHGFTLTGWTNEEALRLGTHAGAHRDAMQAFREDGLSGGVFTSVWMPLRLNRMWTRCPLGHPNDATRADGKCEVCGLPLLPPEPYL